MFLVSSQGRDDKSLRAKERTLEQTLPWSFQPSEGRAAEGNLGQDPGSLCSRPGSGPDSLGHCLLVMSLFSTSIFHLYNRKNESSSHQLGCESTWGNEEHKVFTGSFVLVPQPQLQRIIATDVY